MSGDNLALGFIGTSRFSHTRGRTSDGQTRSGVRYPSPFFDISQTWLPSTMKQLLQWCRYYYMVNPLIHTVVHKMSEYPITEVIIEEAKTALRDTWQKIFDHLRIRAFQVETGLDYNCLAGDTLVTTQDGVFKIRDLTGKTVQVLSQDGVYRPAEFKSYGQQELLEVEFVDGRTILATPDHEWPIFQNGKVRRVPTSELEGKRLLRTVAPRPQKNDDFYEGVRHGFVFGDGTLYNDGQQARANFCGAKDQEMLKYFEGRGSKPYEAQPGVTVIHGLPKHYKTLPSRDASASLWYGFVCGFLAADGSVDVNGCAVLTQKTNATLTAISNQLPRIGMVAGRVRRYETTTAYGESDMEYLSLLKQYMQTEDFLLAKHRANFEENFDPSTNRHHVHVKSVKETGIIDEVFCCVEMETHSFVIDNGVLTGNCYGICLVTIQFPFMKYLVCRNCKTKHKASKTQYKWRNLNYYLQCKKCGHDGPAEVFDHYVKDIRRIRLQRWNPEHVFIDQGFDGSDPVYTFELPKVMRADLMIGKKHLLDTIPDVFVEAIKRNKNIRFSNENVFVLRRPIISQKEKGWGMPLILPVLKDTFYLQILRKAQEQIAQEHIVPLRVIFPAANGQTSDPYTTINLDNWKSMMEAEFSKWKYDQNYIPIMPLPIGNETIGGDGKALMVHQEMQAWSEQIVAGMGVPSEFVWGGMSYSGSNVSMRMLENNFIAYRIDQEHMLNNFIIRSIANYMGIQPVKARMRRFKMADDLQRTSFFFQLNQAQKISDQTLLEESDFDIAQEEKRREGELDRTMAFNRKQQLAMAATQGEMAIVQAKYQAQAQQLMMPPPADPGAQIAGIGPDGQPVQAAEMGQEGAPAEGGAQPGGQQGAMVQGPQADPGMPEGTSVSSEEGTQVPTSGVPDEMSSPLQAGQTTGGGYNLIYLAKRAAAELKKMDPVRKNAELTKMRGMNPPLYQATMRFLVNAIGSQADALNPMQSPLPQQKPERRMSHVGA